MLLSPLYISNTVSKKQKCTILTITNTKRTHSQFIKYTKQTLLHKHLINHASLSDIHQKNLSICRLLPFIHNKLNVKLNITFNLTLINRFKLILRNKSSSGNTAHILFLPSPGAPKIRYCRFKDLNQDTKMHYFSDHHKCSDYYFNVWDLMYSQVSPSNSFLYSPHSNDDTFHLAYGFSIISFLTGKNNRWWCETKSFFFSNHNKAVFCLNCLWFYN